MSQLDRMIYIDDSGHPQSGLVVYGWVEFERELLESDSLGLVVMDGDGSDSTYRLTHRSLKLSDRRIIEDAVHLDSRTSQLVQMADLVAWSAYAHVDRHPGNEFAWTWYSTHVAERDLDREPQSI